MSLIPIHPGAHRLTQAALSLMATLALWVPGGVCAQGAGAQGAGSAFVASGDTAKAAVAEDGETAPTLDDLDQKVRILERQLELNAEDAAKKKEENPTPTAGKDGFTLSSANKESQIKWRGYVQSDGRFFLEEEDADRVTNAVCKPIFEQTQKTTYI